MTRESETGFLSRWSRRKQAVRDGELSEDARDDAADIADENDGENDQTAELQADAARVEQENREAAEAVDLETLSFDSDYSVFLKKGVSTELKNVALRKLWRSNPVLACVDGLNDYDEDFRNVRTLADGLKSSWQVGKGYSWMLEPKDGDGAETADAATELAGSDGQRGAMDGETGLTGDRQASDADEAADIGETADAGGEPATSLAQHELASVAEAPVSVEDAMETALVPQAERPARAVPQVEPPRPARRRMRFQ
ncbi:DUF3306 domain-containing protein [Stappia sp.]|uniref:DUF3306 domain-containing protein n=1 Tax=Stappia sp. TaxID=1870903 RepID=UPI003A9A3FAF